MVEEERVSVLNDKEPLDGDFVTYWMQSSQRAVFNPALEYAVEKGNELNLPVVVYFGLTDDFPEGNKRHYKFMLEGLKEVDKSLENRDIQMVIKKEDPKEGAIRIADESSYLVTDRAYLRFLKGWRSYVSERVDCPFVQVEGDVVVPVETTSDKEGYAARTIRPKIKDKIDCFLKKLKETEPKHSSLDFDFDNYDITNIEKTVNKLDLEDVEPVDHYIGGTSRALERLDTFIDEKLDHYPERSNDPTKDGLSGLSPYLHFGQISPVQIALKVKSSGGPGAEDFLEELVVCRELSMNFVNYNENYDSLKCLPDWAHDTLKEHESDEREYVYSKEEFEETNTHDPYWNAAQKEMLKTGKMHGYMRMYWGKKILEWSETPEEAFRIALSLNNKYELDGRDPNGYTGVAWCFGKHDRAWKERDIFGKVRYMNANGLKRKFDVDEYVEQVESL
ncbi:MAG: deoxyribodipyrimidine photo-lyase [Candidatus Saliniplasma sp.]